MTVDFTNTSPPMVCVIIKAGMYFDLPNMFFPTFTSVESWLSNQLQEGHYMCVNILNCATGIRLVRENDSGNVNNVPADCILTWGLHRVSIKNNFPVDNQFPKEPTTTISKGPFGVFTNAKPFPSTLFALFVVDPDSKKTIIIPLLAYPSLSRLYEEIQQSFHFKQFYLGDECRNVLYIPTGKSYIGSSCVNEPLFVCEAERRGLKVVDNSTVYIWH